MKKHIIGTCIIALVITVACLVTTSHAADFRIGMIGLDTSHVTAFAKQINNPENNYGCKVVAAYKGGSPDIESSANRVDKFTEQLIKEHGIVLYDTVEELCKHVDGILLESVDGRPHLKQAIPVINAGLPMFIDKPMAGSLEDVIQIFKLAEAKNVPCWSSSSLRYSAGIIAMKDNEEIGDIIGVEAFSPCSLNEHHPDLYWYGVHGVEILFTLMGTGCEKVSRMQTKDFELVTGVWKDGRIGTFRGLRAGKHDYGSFVYGTKGSAESGGYGGYAPLVEEIIKFFKTGIEPVPHEETIEMFAFMTAADVSKARNSQPVTISSVIEDAKKKAGK